MQKLIYKLSQKTENLLFWLLILSAIFIPLYPKIPLFSVSGTFVAIRAEDILLAVVYIFLGLYLVFNKKVSSLLKEKIFFLRSNKLCLLMLFFFIAGILSVFGGIFLTHTVSPHLGVLHFIRRVEYMLLLPLAFFAISKRQHIKIFLIIMSATLFIVNFYAFGQKFFNWPVISTGNSEFAKGQILYLTEGARVNSTFAGHYDLAVFLTMGLAIISSLFFVNRHLTLKLWSLTIGITSFIVLIMTAARLSFIATVLAILSSFWLVGKKIFILIFIIFIAAVLIYPSQLRDRFISTIKINIQQEGERYVPQTESQQKRSQLNIPTLSMGATTSAQLNNAFESSDSAAADIAPGEPFDTTDLGVYRSFAIRINYEWPQAIRAFLKNPLTGTGYSSLGLATDNDYLRSLGEVGLLGTISLALVIIEIIRRVVKNYHSNSRLLKFFSAGILSMIIAFLVNGLFIDVFESSKVASLFWMLIGVNLAAGKIVESE